MTDSNLTDRQLAILNVIDDVRLIDPPHYPTEKGDDHALLLRGEASDPLIPPAILWEFLVAE